MTNHTYRKIGETIKLTNGRDGMIKYIGPTEFETGEMIGVELTTPVEFGTNGTFGSKHFESKMGHGVFVRRVSVISAPGLESLLAKNYNNNKTNENNDKNNIGIDLIGLEDDLTFEIGDFVTLLNGQIGELKFIGEVEFAKGEMLGLEMKNWEADQTDGTKHGKKYFDAQSGRGKFIRRGKVKSVLKLTQIKKEMEEKYGEKFEFDPFKRDAQTGKLIDPRAFLEKYIADKKQIKVYELKDFTLVLDK